MKFKSSLGLKRLLNRLIRLINHFLPYTEKIWEIPVIDFYGDPQMEEMVMKYYNAIRDEQAAWLGNYHEDDPNFQAKNQIIRDMESQYGAKLEKYLAPYKEISPRDVSRYEYHRFEVVRYRAEAARRE